MHFLERGKLVWITKLLLSSLHVQSVSCLCSVLLALVWHHVCLWTNSLTTKEDQEAEAPDQAHSELVEAHSDAAAPPESESSRESHSSDSDSDGPILYTDDDDDDDDNASAESKHPAEKLQATFCTVCYVNMPDPC